MVVLLGGAQASTAVCAPPEDSSALLLPYALLVDNFSQPLGQVTSEQAAAGGGRLRWQRFVRLEQGAVLQLDIDMSEAAVVAAGTSNSSLDDQPAAEEPAAEAEFTDAGGYSLPAFLHLARPAARTSAEQCDAGQQRSLPSNAQPPARWLVVLAALCGLEAVGLAAALLLRPGAGQPEACSGQRQVPSAARALVDACCSPMLQSSTRLLAKTASHLSQGQAARPGGGGSPVHSKAVEELPAGWTRYAGQHAAPCVAMFRMREHGRPLVCRDAAGRLQRHLLSPSTTRSKNAEE